MEADLLKFSYSENPFSEIVPDWLLSHFTIDAFYSLRPQLVVAALFILTTSEFIKISEIGSDLPVMKLSTEENPEKKKLLLKMLISAETIRLINDADKKEIFSSSVNDEMFLELNKKVQALKKEYPEEQRVIVTPDLKTKYEVIVKALDAVREVHEAGVSVKLFNQIMFQ